MSANHLQPLNHKHLKPQVHKFFKNLWVTLKFQVPDRRHEASSITKIHKYYALTYKILSLGQPGEKYLCILTLRKIYTGYNRRNGPDFGRVFLMLNYTKNPQNTYIQSSMVMEIQAREKCGLLWCLRTVLCLWRHTRRIWGMGPVYFYSIPTLSLDTAERPCLCQHCIVFGSQWTNMTRVRVFL